MAENFWEKDAVVNKKDEWWSQDEVAQTPAVPAEDRDSTIGSELVRGAKQLASSVRTGIGALAGSPEEAARAGVLRSEAIAEEAGEGASLAAVKQAYQDRGLISAAGEVASQAPRALASQVPQLALMAGGAKTGAVLGSGFGPAGTVVGGALGAGATLLPMFFGMNVERQASEQMERDEEVDISRLAAGAGAAGQTVVETLGTTFVVGKRVVKGILGITDDAALATAKAQKDLLAAANRSLLAAAGRGGARGAAIEMPIEVASTAIERAQAGLDILSPDALTEYGEAAYQAALVGGSLGTITGPGDTTLARRRVAEQPPAASETATALDREREEFARGLGPEQQLPPGTVPAELDVETLDSAAVEPAPPEPPVELPGGFTVARRELSRQDVPEAFGIFQEGAETPLTTVATPQDAQRKLESLTQIRQEEQKRLSDDSDKITNGILAEQRKLEVMEATGQTNTDQYVQAKAMLEQKEIEAAEKLTDINDKIASYSTPLAVAPVGTRTEVQNEFIVNRGDEQIGVFPSLEAAETTLRDIAPEPFKQADVAARTQDIEAVLKPAFAKFNLGNVGLNVVEAIKTDGGQTADGSYARNLIQIAMDAPEPLKTMRHETVHALKELEFFTPQQWKALTERAEKQWIKEYLEGQTAEIEVDGKPQQMSRLDAYKELAKDRNLTPEQLREEIVEEAIADAFGAYDRGATPPPGMIAALYRKLKNFFTNFGQALRGAGFESADDIFQRVERGELKSRKPKAKPKPETAEKSKDAEKLSLPIARGEVVPQLVPPQKDGDAKSKKVKPTVVMIAKYFDDQVVKEFGKKLDYNDKKSFDRAIKTASDEIAYQMQREKSGLDWYEQNIKESFRLTKKVLPALGDPENRSLFSVMAGIMSPQTTARDNWFIAAKAFEHYVDTKNIPGVNPESGKLWQGGTQSPNKKVQLEFLDKMVKDMGQEKAVEWLFTNHPVKEINEFRLKYGNVKSGIGGKLADIVPGLYAFGPKVGPFVSNLNGIYDVTVDKWMTRTFNRYFGTMLGPDGKIVDAPTEPQRRAIKSLINKVAEDAGIKPQQAQSLLWFYEQKLFTELGVLSPSYEFSDGAKKFAESRDRSGEPSVGDAAAPDKRVQEKPKAKVKRDDKKLSIRKGIIAEVAPNPDQVLAESWRQMTNVERLNSTKAVAKKVMSNVFSELDLKGYEYSFSTGTYEGEVNPNIIVKAPKEATEQELDELGRVLGYALDQKAMVVFDEDNKTSGSQAGFVKVIIPDEMTADQFEELRQHIAQVVPQADGDTLRDGALLYGNFSAYNDNVDTLSDAQYHKDIIKAVESFPYDGVIDVSKPETFHSSLIWPDTRSDYLKETRYGDSSRVQGEAGADVRGQRSRRLQAISEEALALRDRWIDGRGAARLGNRERGNAVDFGKPTAEYGTPRQGSVSAVGVHFSAKQRPELLSQFYGTGLRGLERERLSEKSNADIRDRVYFYVDNGKGVRPESGVGGVAHVIRLNNLYDTKSDPLEIVKNSKGETEAARASKRERDIRKAGFDGYLARNENASQDYAILIGKHAVKTNKLSLRTNFPSVKAVKEAVAKTEVPTTPEFKRFIAGNQWSDADGKPTVFYHATAREFFEFTPSGQSKAIFLATTPEEAETFGSVAEDRLRREIYRAINKDEKLSFFQGVVDAQVKKGTITAKQGDEFMRKAKRKAPEYGDFGDIEQETYDALMDLSPTKMSIMPLYARAETPFEFENPDHVERVMQWVANNTEYPQDFPDKWLSGLKGRIKQGLWQAIEDKRVQLALRTLGFDSFTVRENRNSPKNYAVYQPEQVKSVTGNLGEYDRAEKNIKLSLPVIPADIDTRVKETTFKRVEKGFARRIVEAIAPASAAQFRAAAINRYNQMSAYDQKRAEKQGGAVLLADQSAESAALMSDVAAGVAASALGVDNRTGGIPVLRDGITTIDSSVKGVVAALAPLAAYGDPMVMQRYQYWAMVKRGIRLNNQGKNVGITSTDVAFAKTLQEKYPEFVSVQKDLIAFNDGLVKYLVDTGVLSKERGAEYVKYADYVPFYRQMDGDKTVGPNLFSSMSSVKPPKKLKGLAEGQDASEAPLADFLETIVRNTTSAIQAGAKNYAAQRTMNVVTQVTAPGMGATRLKNAVEKTVPGDNIINVLEKGKTVSYETPDELLVYAMSSLNQTDLPFLSIVSAPANLLRNMVTRDPGFMIANLLRDSLSAYVTSGKDMTPIVDTVIGFGKALGDMSPTTRALLDAGVISGYDSGNIEESGLSLERDLAKKAGKRTDPLLLRPFKSLWDGLEKGTIASDAATRAVIYDRVLAETGNEAEALFRSLEVMNFHRKGGSTLIRVLTAAIPFFNARLQGLDLFYRASTGNMNTSDAAAIQRKFFVRGMTMMALSAAYYFMVSDDEEYKKQEQETRDNNWLFPALGIRIPIPFEVGVLFKVVPERIAAYAFGDDTGQDLKDAVLRNAVATFAFNPIPQTVKPVLEAAFDFNSFTWRPIISEGMKDVDPQFQIGPGTSSVAQGIGKTLGLSPMKVDHVIKGYTGTMGMYAIDTIDAITNTFSDTPKATKRFEQMPVIKRFVVDPDARGSVTEYYKLKDSVDSVVRTLNLLEKTGESEAYVEYLKKNKGTLAFRDYIRSTERTMKELRAARVAIRSSAMSGDEKRDTLLKIGQAENKITAEVQRIKGIISSIR